VARVASPVKPPERTVRQETQIDQEHPSTLSRCENQILAFLQENPDRTFSDAQVSVITGYSVKSGGFKNSLYKLNNAGYITRNNRSQKITSEGLQIETNAEVGELTVDLWMRKLSKCEGTVLKILVDNPDIEYSTEQLAEITGYSAMSGGFKNSLYRLNSLELADRSNGLTRLNPEILELIT